MLRENLYQQGMTEDAAALGAACGFVAVSPLIVRECDETGLDDEAVASDANLIEAGRSQEPLLVQYAMDADPFDRLTALWVLGRCAFEDAVRWLSEFPALVPGPDLWLAVNLDYSLGTGATRRLLRYAESTGGGGGSLAEWVTDFAPQAVEDPFRRWWGKAKPEKVQQRLVRQVRRIRDAAVLGSLDARDVPPPPETRPPGCSPMPEFLRRICARLIAARKAGNLTPELQKQAHAEVRAYARTLDRARRARPLIVRAAIRLLPLVPRHADAAHAARGSKAILAA